MRKTIATLLMAIGLLACSKSENENKAMAMMIPPPINANSDSKKEDKTDSAIPESSINVAKKMIYTANVRYRVQDIGQSEKNIKTSVSKYKGYITNITQSHSEGELTSNLTIRVPVAYFDSLLNSSAKEAIYTDFKNIQTEDISEEYYDNETRLKSKRKAHEKYLEILSKAKNVNEVMAVEEQLRIINEEIEAKAGRLKYLDNQVAYSTVELAIYQEIPDEIRPSLPFYTVIWQYLKSGFSDFGTLLMRLFYFIPYLAALMAAYWAYRQWKRPKA
jgi:hypothetical protein